MTNVLLGALVACSLAGLVEGYVLIGRGGRLLNHGDQLLRAAARLLAAVPSKSAPRSDAGPDAQPRRWWQRLRAPAEVEATEDNAAEPESPTPHPTEPESDRRVLLARLHVALQAHAARVPLAAPLPEPEPRPTPGPATVGDLKRAWEVAPPQPVVTDPERDDIDRKLARFAYAEGHTR